MLPEISKSRQVSPVSGSMSACSTLVRTQRQPRPGGRRLNWRDVLVPFCGSANCCAQEQDHAFHGRPSSRSPHRWVVVEAAAGSPSGDYKLAMDSADRVRSSPGYALSVGNYES
jgi:hypothetical protein